MLIIKDVIQVIKKLMNEVKSIILYNFTAFVILSIAYFSVALVIMFYTIEVNKYEIINNELLLTSVEKTTISNKIDDLVTDILYLSDTLRIRALDSKHDFEVEKQWLAFLDRKKIYEEIHYIDMNGNEIIRIHFSKDGSYVIEEKELLQNSTKKYNFSHTIHLNEGAVFISEFDMNEKDSQIEYPSEQILYLSTPFFDVDGELEGIIILDYYASDLLQQIKKIASTSYGNIYILNSKGYWICNTKDMDKEWTFLYKDKINDTFQSEFPQEWEVIKSEPYAYLSSSKGVFSWSNIINSKEFMTENASNSIIMDDVEWYIVSHILPESAEGKTFSLNMKERIAYILKNDRVSMVFIIVVSIIFGIQMTLSKIKKDEIKYFSEYDMLTDVYNRRAAFEKLNKICKDATKEKLSVCFIDINGLKEVNDYLGHEVGDELILNIVKCIKKMVRDSDLIARLGGDEFLIIFSNMGIEEAEKIWMRISKEFDLFNETQNKKYIISVSHGIEEFQMSSTDSIDAIINKADERMYDEKRIMKKDVKIIRD